MKIAPIAVVMLLIGSILVLTTVSFRSMPLSSSGVAALSTATPLPFLPSLTPRPTQLPVASSPTATLPPSPTPNPADPTPTPTLSPTPTPNPQLSIPAQGIILPITPVLIVDGFWNVDDLADEIGWLETTGDSPLSELAPVLVGHSTLPTGNPLASVRPGPFFRLDELLLGDQIIFQHAGQDYIYEIIQVGRLRTNDVRQIYIREPGTLILLTCTDWDGSASSYLNRLIVRAQLVQPAP